MSSTTASPLYPTFDAEGCVFLGTTFCIDHLFDVYIHESIVDGIKEILAVSSEHESSGPIAMAAPLCNHYKEGHPLHFGLIMAKAKNLL